MHFCYIGFSLGLFYTILIKKVQVINVNWVRGTVGNELLIQFVTGIGFMGWWPRKQTLG